MSDLQDELKRAIRTIPDYPHKGIMFRDITTLLSNPSAFRRSVDAFVHPFTGKGISQVVGIDARRKKIEALGVPVRTLVEFEGE